MTASDSNVELLRVVVLSPGDVAEERDTVALVCRRERALSEVRDEIQGVEEPPAKCDGLREVLVVVPVMDDFVIARADGSPLFRA